MKRAGLPSVAETNTRSLPLNDGVVERREFLRGLSAWALTAGLPGATALARAKSSPRRIDVHHHFVPPLFEQTARERNVLHPLLNGVSAGRSLEEMDRNGVASAVLS